MDSVVANMGWTDVCSIGEIPNEGLKELEVSGTTILLARRDAQVFALPPLCPHMREPLCNGVFDGETLTCLKHLWQWNIDTGESTGEAEKSLKQYMVKVDDERVLVDLTQVIEYEYED